MSAIAASRSIGCSYQKVRGVVPRLLFADLHSYKIGLLTTLPMMDALRTCTLCAIVCMPADTITISDFGYLHVSPVILGSIPAIQRASFT